MQNLPNVLVTGGTGRVGRMVRNAWHVQNRTFKPIYIGRRAPSDICWPTDLTRSLPHADAVVAMWGQTSGSFEQLMENLLLARAARDLALTSGATRVLHMSSSSVYGPGVNMNEDFPLKPVTDYGRYKCATEELILSFQDDDITHCILRTANVVGADSLAPIFTGADPITLDQFDDGCGPLRSYAGAWDLARTIEQLIHLPAPDLPPVLNIATPVPLEMATLIRSAGRKFSWRPASRHALKEVSQDTRLLQTLLPDIQFETDTDVLVSYFHKLNRAA